MIETRLLRNALMLTKHQNFARAAKALNISQPTLSRSIQLLEKTVGERLFDRVSRTIRPTQAGEIMLKHARLIISSSEAMQEEIERHQGILEGSLHIGSGPYPASALLAPAIGQFGKHFPDIDITISVDDWSKFPRRMMQEDFDYVLMITSQLDTTLGFEVIHLDPHPAFLFCRAGHPLLEKTDLSIHDLSQFRLISTTLPKRLSDALENLLFPRRESGASSNKLKKFFCNDMGAIKSTVFHSDLIGVGTYGTLKTELEAGLFVALPFRIPEFFADYGIVKRKGLSLSPAARALIKILVEKDKEQSKLEADLIESLGPEIAI